MINHHRLIINTRITALALLIFPPVAYSDINLIIPVATSHIVYSGDGDYNNKNYGIGFSYENNNQEAGLVYIKKDSHKNENMYYFYSRNYIVTKDLKLSASIMLPTGYESLAIVPIWFIKYKMLRISTTLPLAKIIGQRTDVINAQLIVPVRF